MEETLKHFFLENNYNLLDCIIIYVITEIITGGFNEKD